MKVVFWHFSTVKAPLWLNPISGTRAEVTGVLERRAGGLDQGTAAAAGPVTASPVFSTDPC